MIRKTIVVFASMLNGCLVFAQGLSVSYMKDTLSYRNSTKAGSYPAKVIKFEQIIPQNYYTQHFGFFCRQELRMQQAKVPVTFRLGSMEQCNRLEQKPGYR